MISEIYQRKFSASGFEVDTAMSASETLEKAKNPSYDLVLLDLVLPEMNGMEILEKMRTDSAYDPNLKVAIFSNLNDQENQEKATRLGAIGYIEKSLYSPTELVEEVRRILHTANERSKNQQRRQAGAFGEVASSEEEESDRKRILFIEDEEVFIEIFGNKLKDEGYAVDFATRGDEGVDKALAGVYDLIITDMLIPGIKGDEVVRELRENEKTKNTPIFVLSASATDEEIARVREYGIQEFCLKTHTTPSNLLERVHGILRS